MAPSFLGVNAAHPDTPLLSGEGPEVHERGISIVVICALLEISILTCVIARLWVRKFLQNRIGPSDGAITMATVRLWLMTPALDKRLTAAADTLHRPFDPHCLGQVPPQSIHETSPI